MHGTSPFIDQLDNSKPHILTLSCKSDSRKTKSTVSPLALNHDCRSCQILYSMCVVRVFSWACTGVWFDVRAETLTLIPALLLFALAIYLGGLVIYVLKDPNEQKAFSSYALYAFAGGIMLIICWVVYLSLSRRIVRTE